MEHCAAKYDVDAHVRFGTEVANARFDAAAGRWRVRTTAGEELSADFLVSGVGQLNQPAFPAIAGRENFRGVSFHSARWDHGYDLRGKNVAVIGNAASAIQFIPQIAPKVAQLFIFQRTPNWMIERGDREYGEAEKRRLARFPWLARLYRWFTWAAFESGFPTFRGNKFFAERLRKKAETYMKSHIHEPALQKALTPDYAVGAKRLLISDDYYPALARRNVELITQPIVKLTEHTVVTSDGKARRVDAVIFATGFRTTEFLVPMVIEGPDGRTLNDTWRDGAEAYLGISVAGFPNLFLMYGPNTNLGHNSIIFMIECQTAYIMDCLRKVTAAGAKSLDLRPEVQRAYNERLQRELQKTVWAQISKSWYKNEAGRVTNNWSGTTTAYWWRTRKADLSLYRLESRASAAAAATPPASAQPEPSRTAA
jgi:cation diffusion facilitator CzcD-associated flavoprotein CzcO